MSLEKLNPQQREAVKTKDGIFQITAIAGSGKTEVLTKRVSYMINEHEIFPDEILLLTFSKTAENEMKERLKKVVSPRILDKITIGTFHSLAYRILREEYTRMRNPLASAFKNGENSGVMKSYQQKNLIEKILKEDLSISNNKNNISANDILRDISLAKNELLDVNDFLLQSVGQREHMIYEVYRLYEYYKNEENIIDFDDMLIKLYKLLKENPTILSKYQQKFKYLLVDEAQDNNLIQYELIDLIAALFQNIFIVGDDDQSMFRFRGAKPDRFVNFSKRYPSTKIIHLEKNYRSVPQILEVASNLIKHNTIRIEKELIPSLEPSLNDECVTHQAILDTESEAALVCENIQNKINNDNRVFNDFAIIYRTNSQSAFLEDELIKQGIPYYIYGSVSFYERKEIKDIISYLKLSYDPNDNESFERVVNTPTRYLGAAFMKVIKEESRRKRCSYYQALKTARLTPVQHRNGMDYLNKIKGFVEYAKHHDPSMLLEQIIKETKYEEYLQKENHNDEDNNAFDNIETLKIALNKYSKLEEFFEFYKNIVNNNKTQTNSVKLMTMHKSKGLEFPIVYGVGLSEKLAPHRYSIESFDQFAIEEERRLVYVLFTRAKLELHLSSPLKYNKNNLSVSRFIAEAKIKKKDI